MRPGERQEGGAVDLEDPLPAVPAVGSMAAAAVGPLNAAVDVLVAVGAGGGHVGEPQVPVAAGAGDLPVARDQRKAGLLAVIERQRLAQGSPALRRVAVVAADPQRAVRVASLPAAARLRACGPAASPARGRTGPPGRAGEDGSTDILASSSCPPRTVVSSRRGIPSQVTGSGLKRTNGLPFRVSVLWHAPQSRVRWAPSSLKREWRS